jgi:hypothetical protein
VGLPVVLEKVWIFSNASIIGLSDGYENRVRTVVCSMRGGKSAFAAEIQQVWEGVLFALNASVAEAFPPRPT